MPESTTVEDFVAMNPAQQLRFAEQLGHEVTPEVVSLVIRTYLTTNMSNATRKIYWGALQKLIIRVDTLKLIVLTYRYVNPDLDDSSPSAPVHKTVLTALLELQKNKGFKWGYARVVRVRGRDRYYVGSSARRIEPINLEKLLQAGLRPGDGLLYRRGRTYRSNESLCHVAHMVLIPMQDKLPDTLGL